MMHTATPQTGWQILAQLDLLVTPDFESQVQTWITEIMSPIGIAPEQLNKVIKSALEAEVRIENQKSKDVNFPLVSIRAYLPLEVPTRSGTSLNWGFFRIDKHGLPSTRSDHADHLVEFFLYLDG
jgi:hypothetical protein